MSSDRLNIGPPFVLSFALLLLTGCGSGDLAQVRGRVTLDGEPVAKAIVEFVPQGERGAPSYGLTDEKGEYQMQFTRSQSGATIGSNQVRITSDDEASIAGKRISPGIEVFDTRYNTASELSVDVKAGSNRFDFDCESGQSRLVETDPSEAGDE